MLSALSNGNPAAAITAFAVLLLVAGYLLWRHIRITRRAIVKISHVSDNGPALHWTGDGPFYVVVEIRNLGKTSAQVTDVFLACCVLPRGTQMIPNYETAKAAQPTMLAPGETFDRTFTLEISPADRVGVYAKTAILFVYGYVDYTDRFGGRHRSGYGRCYDPDVTPDNLAMPEQFGLNFDT